MAGLSHFERHHAIWFKVYETSYFAETFRQSSSTKPFIVVAQSKHLTAFAVDGMNRVGSFARASKRRRGRNILRVLIINGDDMGRTPRITQGILKAYEQGILTSASMVANGADFDSAAAMAKQYTGLGVGIHLVLNEYQPVAEPRLIPGLLNAAGAFWPRPLMLAKLQSSGNRCREAAIEWEAQIAKIVDAGVSPTHLDGHGHCHATPRLAETVLRLAKKFNIGAVRLPAEPLSYRGFGGAFSARRYVEKAMLFTASQWARSRWRTHLAYPDMFYGFMDGGRLSAGAIARIAGGLRPGVAELMTHPGIDNDDSPYNCNYNWRGDLDALLSSSKEAFEAAYNLKLRSYRDAWSHA